jgi:hypothetical protein
MFKAPISPLKQLKATGEFIVKDAGGRALAYFYWWDDGTTALLTRDEARCLAEKFAKMPSFILRVAPPDRP